MMLRMKVWTAPDGSQHVVSLGVMTKRERHVTGELTAYIMSDDGTGLVRMSIDDYNALPYFWFTQGERAKAASPRQPDLVVL